MCFFVHRSPHADLTRNFHGFPWYGNRLELLAFGYSPNFPLDGGMIRFSGLGLLTA